MGDTPHDELFLKVIKPVEVFQNQRELPHQFGIFKVLLQVRVEFGDKQGIVRRQRRDERRIDAQVRLGSMTGPAGSAIAIEGFVEEKVLPLGDQIARGSGRGLAG